MRDIPPTVLRGLEAELSTMHRRNDNEVGMAGMERVPLRSTSIRLRKRRDQAKREFLVNRRSGDFGYQAV